MQDAMCFSFTTQIAARRHPAESLGFSLPVWSAPNCAKCQRKCATFWHFGTIVDPLFLGTLIV